MNINNLDIIALGQELADEESISVSCIFCNATWEKSLSITRNGSTYLYNCFRAKCGVSGKVYTLITESYYSTGVTAVAKNNNKKERVLENRHLNDNDYKYIWDKYGIGKEILDINNVKIANDIYLLHNNSYKKLYKNAPGPKAFYIGNKEINWLSPHSINHTIIIVEDLLSAMKIKQSCITLLRESTVYVGYLSGTHLSKNMLDQDWGYCNILFCLDPDATHISIKYVLKYGCLFKSAAIVALDKDPKDMSEQAIREKILSRVKD